LRLSKAAPRQAWLVKRKEIGPHIPVFHKSDRDGTFSMPIFGGRLTAAAFDELQAGAVDLFR
jgi:hypothetical protein